MRSAATIHLHAVCHDCRRHHAVDATPATWLARLSEWEVKHRGHRIEFRSPRRTWARRWADRWVYPTLDRWGAPWWLSYQPNADLKLAYAASADLTITLASLASSADFTAGRESTAVSNASNLYLDYLVGGKITTGTSPTATKQIRVYAYGTYDDGPTYPDVLDGTDSAETISSVGVLATFPLVGVVGTSATSDVTYPVVPRALSLAFGGAVPKNWGLYVAHDTGVALHATGGNHDLSYTGVYATG